MIVINANKFGHCPSCDSEIDLGDPIVKIRRSYPWIHATCALRLQRMRQDGISRRAELDKIRN
jgi:hypothetical protein